VIVAAKSPESALCSGFSLILMNIKDAINNMNFYAFSGRSAEI
jgi:hypothetical protein